MGYLNSSFAIKQLLDNSPKTGTGDVIISVQALEPLLIPQCNNRMKEKIETLVDKINVETQHQQIQNEIDLAFRQILNISE